jgi:tyrosyl-tRNA synthetase
MATIEHRPAREQAVVGDSTDGGDETALARLLRHGTAEVIHETELLTLLRSTDRPLRVKFGVDPSSADLHLGHTVCFRKLREFQELGHTIVIIIGDWTAQIGDPTGRSATRRMLTPAEMQANATTYTDQLFRIISRQGVEVRYQSEWFGGFTLESVFQLAAHSTVAQMLAREDFRARYQAGQPLAVVELLYPLLQAYDSIAVDADVELGGLDQKFNLLMGRELQAAFGERPQQLVMMPLLVGTDGVQKMSKSLGNAIAIVEPPDEMFGKVMSLPDSAILQYVDLVTDLPEDERRRIAEDLAAATVNPRDLKRRLGREIVARFHAQMAADAADERFMHRFSRRELPSEIDEVRLSDDWFNRPVRLAALLVAVGLARSKGEARRLMAGGAIRLNGGKVVGATDEVSVEPRTVVQVSRRRFVRLVRV